MDSEKVYEKTNDEVTKLVDAVGNGLKTIFKSSTNNPDDEKNKNT